MGSLRDIVDANARINYDQLQAYVSENSLSDFTSQTPHPFLVGKELYEGELSQAAQEGKRVGSDTMRFSAAQFRQFLNQQNDDQRETTSLSRRELENQPPQHTGISRAIYMIRKKPFSTERDPNIITIGRGSGNDIVVADYVVSKLHAQIILFKGMYFLVDMNSTNGTKVNNRPISPNVKVQLQLNATVVFGRIAFVFTPPLQVYRGMRREIMGY